MRKTLISLSICCALLPALPGHAQNNPAAYRSDMPVLYFSQPPAQPKSPGATDSLMQQMAAAEAKHLDSLVAQYTISDPRLRIYMGFEKMCCLFIAHNWQALQVPDTVLTQSTVLPAFMGKVFGTEYTTYASVASGSPAPADFAAAYKQAFTKSLATLANGQQQAIMQNIVSTAGTTPDYFNSTWDTLWKAGPVADTNLLRLFIAYSKIKLNENVGHVILDYYYNLVKDQFTRADTLRGTLSRERSWWDVQRYDVSIKPNFTTKTIEGKNKLTYTVTTADHLNTIQLDLQEPMQIDSIFADNTRSTLLFKKDGNAWHVQVPAQIKNSTHALLIYFHGKIHEAVRPPWDGGASWSQDSLNRPMMTITCQGLGASVWYPCKDHQSDEPDKGASLSMVVPDTLVGVSNGRLISKTDNHNGTTSYKWGVVNPINNYELIPYIGKYVGWGETYKGKKGDLTLHYWVLDYHEKRAKAYMPVEVKKMLQAHESYFGPYPFYEDGYQLVESPVGGSMEHQSAVAYSGNYDHGYTGNTDLSGTGWGKKWDYMIVHESGHEWFGNSITTKDLADLWVHEGFTCYSETLYTEYYFGKEAGNAYNVGLRQMIANIFPIIGYYGVNDDVMQRSQDMYVKSSALLQTIRHSMADDEKFKAILQGLQTAFYHQTVTTAQVEHYFNEKAGYDYGPVFDQYLRNTDIPELEYRFSADRKTVSYRYTNCIKSFNLPLLLTKDKAQLKIAPTTEWKTTMLTATDATGFDPKTIKDMYYITVNERK
jgi:hypothetical protein